MASYVIENGVLLRYTGDAKTVNIPDGVTHIGSFAFRRRQFGVSKCQSHARTQKINIPDSVISIGESAFMEFSFQLSSIEIPKSVEKIEEFAFAALPNVSSISVDKSNPNYFSKGDCLIETKTHILIAGCKNSVLPDDESVTKIESGAFAACLNLKSLDIPKGVVSIEKLAFSNCKNLEKIRMPNSLTHIEKSAFDRCVKLTIYAPEGSYAESYAKENNIPFVAI